MSKSTISPSKLAHVVLHTRSNLDAMVEWYCTVLGARIVFNAGRLIFLTYDDEHHRIAIAASEDLTELPRRTAGLEFQLFSKRRNLHSPSGISALGAGTCVTCILDVGIRCARHHFLRVAVPPGVGHHSMRRRKRACRNRCVPHAGFRRGIGIRGVAEPRAFLYKPLQSSSPLPSKFVHVIRAHLVHHQHDH